MSTTRTHWIKHAWRWRRPGLCSQITSRLEMLCMIHFRGNKSSGATWKMQCCKTQTCRSWQEWAALQVSAQGYTVKCPNTRMQSHRKFTKIKSLFKIWMIYRPNAATLETVQRQWVYIYKSTAKCDIYYNVFMWAS